MRKMKISMLMLLLALLLVPCLCFGAAAAETADVTVYLDAENGADTNTGLTEALAVKTMEKAYGVLAENMPEDGTQGRIVLVSDYTHTMTATNQTIVSDAHDYEIVITGKTAKTVLTVAYSGTAYLGLQGPTTFEGLVMNVGTSTNMTIYGNNGGHLKIGEDVTTTSTTKFKLSAGPMKSGYKGNMSLEVNSGSWQDLFAGCYMYTLEGNGSLVMNGGSAVNVETTYNGKQTGDLSITINGGTVTNLYGGARHKNGVVTGNVTVNLNGGTIKTLLDPDGVGTVSGTALLNLGGGELTVGTGIRVNVTGTAAGTTTVTVNGTPTYGTAYVTASGTAADDAVIYTQGTCAVSGTDTKSFALTEAKSLNIALKYDDRKALTGLLGQAPVEVSVSNEQVASNKVGTDEADDHVLVYENGTLYAVGTGTATLTVNGTAHTVTVTPAPITLLMITGHSVGAGDGGSIHQSVLCEAGQVYSSHRPYSITSGEGGLGYGSAVRAGCKASDGSTVGVDNQQHLDAFTAAGIGTTGEGSALGYRWNQLTGEKVWVLNFAVGGSCLNEWQTGVKGHSTWTEYHFDTAVKSFGYAQTVVKNEIAAKHYTLGHMVAFYHDGVNYSNYPGWTYEKIEQDYLSMWNGYKTALATDMDGDGDTETVECLGLLPFYNFSNEYNDHFDKPAAYYMASSAQYPDVFLASNIYFNWMREEGLSTFPDINYATQGGAQLNKPVSIAHQNNGGTSTDSVFCKADNMHPTQVVHNVVGMNIAESLYSYLHDAHETETVTLQDQAHNAVTALNMVVGEKRILVPMITPKVKGNVTYQVSGVLELSYPLQITATAVGTGTLSALVNGEAVAQVTVTVTENDHVHCICGGHGVKVGDHTCDASESWIAWGDDAYEQGVLPFLSGNYYLVSNINVTRSMLVEEGEDIRLCLNGCSIYTNTERVLNNQGNMVLTDCGAAADWGTVSSAYSGSYSQVFYNYPIGVLDIYAGNLVAEGSSSWGCVGLNQGGIVNVYGGCLQGTTAVVKNNLDTRGGTLYVMGGTVTIYGGTIRGGQASSGGNIYAEKGTLHIAGGNVIGGNGSLGGNIYGSYYTDINISGGVIENGVSKNEGGNLYLYTSSTTDADGNTVSRHSSLTVSGGVIQNGSATRGNQIFATTGGNLSSGNWTITVTGGTISGQDTDAAAVVLRNNSHAVFSGGTVSGGVSAIRLERSSASGAAPKLTLKGAVTLAGSETELYVENSKGIGTVTLEELTAQKLIRVDGLNVGNIASSSTDCSGMLTASREGYAVSYASGKLSLVPATVQVVAGQDIRNFAAVEQAAAFAEEGFVRLLADAEVTMTLTQDLYIDLNGFDMIGTVDLGGFAVYGMDSTTDKYTCETMGYFNCTDIDGAKVVPQQHFKGTAERLGTIRRYMAISTAEGYTFHRFYLGITKITLKTSTCGFGYRAVFGGDEMVVAQLDEAQAFGFELSLGEDTPVQLFKERDAFVSAKEVTLRLDNFDVEHYGETPLNAKVLLKLADGTVIESAQYTMTMRYMLETLNDMVLEEAKLEAVRAFIENNPIIKKWDTANLY